MQEGVRKDVERAFGVLQAKFKIIGSRSRSFSVKSMRIILKACIILHNMTREDRSGGDNTEDDIEPVTRSNYSFEFSECPILNNIRGLAALNDSTGNADLKRDLIEHIWNQRKYEN